MKKGKKTAPVKRNGGGRKKLNSGKSNRPVTVSGTKKAKVSKASTSRSTTKKVKKLTFNDLHREIRSIRSIVEDTNNVIYFLKGLVEGRFNPFEKQVLGSISEIKTKIGLDYTEQSIKQQAAIVDAADLLRAEATAAIPAPEELEDKPFPSTGTDAFEAQIAEELEESDNLD